MPVVEVEETVSVSSSSSPTPIARRRASAGSSPSTEQCPAIGSADGVGRPLFAANRDVAEPADPVAALLFAACEGAPVELYLDRHLDRLRG